LPALNKFNYDRRKTNDRSKEEFFQQFNILCRQVIKEAEKQGYDFDFRGKRNDGSNAFILAFNELCQYSNSKLDMDDFQKFVKLFKLFDIAYYGKVKNIDRKQINIITELIKKLEK
jgi:hypothetical protein